MGEARTCPTKKNVRNSKYDPIVERVELLQANPQYAFVKLPNGKECSVSLRDLAPCGSDSITNNDNSVQNRLQDINSHSNIDFSKVQTEKMPFDAEKVMSPAKDQAASDVNSNFPEYGNNTSPSNRQLQENTSTSPGGRNGQTKNTYSSPPEEITVRKSTRERKAPTRLDL